MSNFNYIEDDNKSKVQVLDSQGAQDGLGDVFGTDFLLEEDKKEKVYDYKVDQTNSINFDAIYEETPPSLKLHPRHKTVFGFDDSTG